MCVLFCLLIIVDVLFLLICYVVDKKISKLETILLFSTILFSIIALCLCQNPPETFDLYRYFIEMKYYRTLNFGNLLHEIVTYPNFIWRLFQIFIASVFKYNNMIFLFSVPITVFPLIYILLNKKISNKINSREFILSIFSYFSIINAIHIFSGIRNAMAVSIYFLGLYLVWKKNKRYGYLFCLMSLFIHPMTLIFFLLQIFIKAVYKIKLGKHQIFQYILLLWPLFARIVLALLKLISKFISIPFVNQYVIKLSVEINLKISIDYRVYILEILQIIVIILFVSKFIKHHLKFSKEMYFIYYLCFFVLGSISMPTLFSRVRFLLAYMLPVVFSNVNKIIKDHKDIKMYSLLCHILLILAIFINIFYSYYMYCNDVFY